jgi:hypothetical protein
VAAAAVVTNKAARDEHSTRIALFNKDEHMSIDLAIRGLANVTSATAWRMQAPALDATQDLTLAGAQILPHAQWSPRVEEPVAVSNGVAHLHVPSSSAALLILK